jgi:hypothetical protein
MGQDDLNTLPDTIKQLKQLVMSVQSDLVIQNKTIEYSSKTIQNSRSEIVRLN